MATKAAPKKKKPSVIKRVKQSEKRRLHNKAYKTRIKTQIKKLEEILNTKDRDKIDITFRETVKIISSAASKGIIHRNTASRKISRIAKKVNQFLANNPTTESSNPSEVS
ncbi:MAG: 30S ribosomal protein S20 [Thermodesulfovibrionales bacterium]|nr:30S ribosomal protein S20 [Thermodesulfovibrionales bacterium]